MLPCSLYSSHNITASTLRLQHTQSIHIYHVYRCLLQLIIITLYLLLRTEFACAKCISSGRQQNKNTFFLIWHALTHRMACTLQIYQTHTLWVKLPFRAIQHNLLSFLNVTKFHARQAKPLGLCFTHRFINNGAFIFVCVDPPRVPPSRMRVHDQNACRERQISCVQGTSTSSAAYL